MVAQREPASTLREAFSRVVQSLRFALGFPPGSALAESGDARGERTLLHEIVIGGHWHLFAPSDEALTGAAAGIVKGAALSAALLAIRRDTVAAPLAASTPVLPSSNPGSPSVHIAESQDTMRSARELFEVFRDDAQKVSAHETEDHATDGVEDDDLSGAPAVNGEPHADSEDSGRQLLQLVQRKWNRVYAVLFVRAMLLRVILVAYAWGAITARAGYASAGTQFDLFCSSSGNTDARLATLGSCSTVRNLIIVLTAGALSMLVFHGWRLVVYGGLSIWRAFWSTKWAGRGGSAPASIFAGGSLSLGDRGRATRGRSINVRARAHLSHRAAAYVAGHSGAFGHFYVATILLSSACISIAGLVDILQGWANASVLYAFGGFFA